jgi:two-component system nitrogen regulation response regulator GlnG
MNPSNSGHILIIDDDKDLCELLAHLLEHAGYKTKQGYDGNTAINLLSQCEPDLLLLDSVIPEPNGMAVLAKAHSMYPQLPVIIITGTAGILSAVCAIKAGAWDYLPKPFDNNRVLELVNRAVQTRGSKNDINSSPNKDISARISELMGKSAETQKIIKDIIRVAHTNFSVIIQGETGTGKEMIARNIHLSSKRATADFIPIDCGAMSDSLIENELFGHEKGSFTGADHLSIGKFEAANGGTLFLDEIANMSLSAQSKLLRVLQERVIYRIGGLKAIPVNVRILVASNESLLDEVIKGKFREDLYYRLNEYVIHIQPLRERPDDILFLADRFMTEVCTELSIELLSFSKEVKKLLLSHPWTGNVRELRAVIRRVTLISHKEVSVEDLNFLFNRPHEQDPVNLASNSLVNLDELTRSNADLMTPSCLSCIEQGDYKDLSLTEINRLNNSKSDKFIIQSVLKETGNNKAEAARRLKIDYKSLCSKLKGIIKPEEK